MAIKTKVKRRFLTAAAAAGGLVLAAGLALYLCSGADGLDSVVLSVCFLGTSAAVLALLTGGVLLLLRRHIGAVLWLLSAAYDINEKINR